MDGIIVINKPKGFTSQDVCAKLRGMLHQKKIGHTGTLDPDATGVLPVLLGKATKLSDMLTAQTKVYKTVMKLGVRTDTLDLSGNILETADVNSSEDDIRRAVMDFVGEIKQIPPMYSAIKVDGKKLYELARKGEEVERKPRIVQIEKIEINEIQLPYVTMTVTCSKGTYIRTLCDDIGKSLSCYGAMAKLTRLRSGDFGIEDAISIDELQKLVDTSSADSRIISLKKALSKMETFVVNGGHEKALYNGNIIDPSWGKGCTEGEVLVFSESDELVGIYEKNKEGLLKPKKMLL